MQPVALQVWVIPFAELDGEQHHGAASEFFGAGRNQGIDWGRHRRCGDDLLMAMICKKGCGKCCKVGSSGMVLPVTREEAMAVAAALGRVAVDPVEYAARAHCPALEDGICKAYDSRPQVCRDFQCNGEDVFVHSGDSLHKLELLAYRKEPVFDLRAFLPESVEQTLNRHERTAFQFSGGKDSTAALLLLKPYWNRFTVYYCDSGDSMPETDEIVERLAKQVPRFERVTGLVMETRAEFGIPTDMLPQTSAYAVHWLNAGSTPLMQDRVSCCFRSVMEPMHKRMVADGITLVIRGQKASDSLKGPLRSGMVAEGIEFLYPIEDWTDEAVFAFLRENDVSLQKFYGEGANMNCLGCTAWLDGNRAAYLKKHHPEAFDTYRHNMRVIADAVLPIWQNLNQEIQNCEE